MAVYAFGAHGLSFITLDLFDPACQAARFAPSVLGPLAVATKQASEAVFARMMMIELTSHASAHTRDDVPAGLQMRLIVLVAASKGMQILPSLGVVERKLELSGVTLGVRRRLPIAGGRVFVRVNHVGTWNVMGLSVDDTGRLFSRNSSSIYEVKEQECLREWSMIVVGEAGWCAIGSR